MRVIAFSRSLPFHHIGGMEAMSWDILRLLAKKGCEVTAVTTRIVGKPERFMIDGVDVVQLPTARSGRYSRAWWKGSREIFLARRRETEGVILSIGFGGYGLLKLHEELRGFSVVLQAHGTPWGEFVSKWRSGRPIQWLKSCKNLYWMLKSERSYFRFDHIVLVNDGVADQFRKRPKIGRDMALSYSKIANGIDCDMFRPDRFARERIRQSFGWEKEVRVAIFVGRLHPQKGCEQAIKAFLQARKMVPDAKLLIVGGGVEEQALRKLVLERGASDDIKFTGAVKREFIPGFLAASDVFVFPCLGMEGLTLTIMEALATGLRVVCSDYLQQACDSTLPISFAQPNQEESFGKAVADALLMGGASTSLLPQRFGLDACIDGYLKLFAKLQSR